MAHLTVKFFGTSVWWTNAGGRNKQTKKRTVYQCIEHVKRLRKKRQNRWFSGEKKQLFPCKRPRGWRVSVTVSCDWLWEGQRHWLRHTARKTHGRQTHGAQECAHCLALVGSANPSHHCLRTHDHLRINHWPRCSRCQLFLHLYWVWVGTANMQPGGHRDRPKNTACQQSAAVHLGDAMPQAVPFRDRGRGEGGEGIRRGGVYLKTNKNQK